MVAIQSWENDTFYAHSENSSWEKHDLVRHLQAVAERASQFAGKFGAANSIEWVRTAINDLEIGAWKQETDQ